MSSDSLQGRIYEFCLADLQKDEDQAFRKIKLKCEDISGRNCLTNFFAMDFTRDKLCSLVRSTASGGWAAGSVRWGEAGCGGGGGDGGGTAADCSRGDSPVPAPLRAAPLDRGSELMWPRCRYRCASGSR